MPGRKAPEHLQAIYAYLGARPWPFAKFDGDGYLKWISDAQCVPGPYQKPGRDGTAKVMVVGEWKKKRFNTESDTLQDRNLPRQCQTYAVPQYYAVKLGMGRYVSPATYNALATLLLLNAGVVSPPVLFDDAVARFRGFAGAIFDRVTAGELRIDGAFALYRLLEVLHTLMQVHAWIRNGDAKHLHAPLSRDFVAAVQHECADPLYGIRDAFNERCAHYAHNLARDPATKAMMIAEGPAALGRLYDTERYPTSKRRQGEVLQEHEGDGFAEYWAHTLSPARWYRLVKQAEGYGFIERAGYVGRANKHEDTAQEQALQLWTFAEP
jgi:hypothetical protein